MQTDLLALCTSIPNVLGFKYGAPHKGPCTLVPSLRGVGHACKGFRLRAHTKGLWFRLFGMRMDRALHDGKSGETEILVEYLSVTREILTVAYV